MAKKSKRSPIKAVRAETKGASRFEIRTWGALEEEYKGSSLLIGNGASMAVWRRFGYASLFETAQSNQIDAPLSAADIQLFESYGEGTNFERVLYALLVAQDIATLLRVNANRKIVEHYQHIKQALFQAIRAVHVPWDRISADQLLAIRHSLRHHSSVFSTNYDLLVYWAIMARDNAEGFVDFFWNNEGIFDFSDRKPRRTADTKVFYLHGGIHLYRNSTGSTYKRFRQIGGSLLDEAQQLNGELVTPLLVSEGSYQQKLSSILNSDYLSFAYNALQNTGEKIVIFGHGLEDTDRHLYDAILQNKKLKLAVSVFSDQTEEEKIAFMARVLRIFKEVKDVEGRELIEEKNEVDFFDSNSHPLGAAALTVEA